MLKLIKGVFSGGENVTKGLDMVDKGLDAMFFTDEEKSQAGMKKLEWKLKWISATGAQSVARRVIAFIIVGMWSYLVLLATHLHLIGMTEEAKFIFNTLKDIVHWPFITIIGFYFAAHLMRSKV